MAPSVQEMRQAQRAEGPATVLGIGTANPPNCYYQTDYPDYYFRVTNSDHMTALKDKFKLICDKSMIEKRYMYLTEEILKQNQNMCTHSGSSHDTRQKIMVMEVPKLGKEAAEKAIEEWGQPKSNITHLIMCTMSGVDMPGADYQLTKLLGLRPSVRRFMIYQQGCFAGGSALRMAKDIAENNKGARVLVVCSEMMSAVVFRGPSETDFISMQNLTAFGDGAAAVVVGADPDLPLEKPIFELVWAAQTILPDSEDAITGHLREDGLYVGINKYIPGLISTNLHTCLAEAFSPLDITDWESLFLIVHPGWSAIVNQVEEKLGLTPGKLKATKQVLNDYGNMASATVLFIMDRMRKNSVNDGQATTGEGLEWGVLFGFGPGFTVETVVLRSVTTKIKGFGDGPKPLPYIGKPLAKL